MILKPPQEAESSGLVKFLHIVRAIPAVTSRCQASHVCCVCAAEPAYFVESLEPMEVTAGDAVCLKCQVGGTPEIKVSWFKADGKVRSSPNCKLEYSKGTACLKLSKATKADIGEYTCKAENRIGSASSTCRLNVLGDHLISSSNCCSNVQIF